LEKQQNAVLTVKDKTPALGRSLPYNFE